MLIQGTGGRLVQRLIPWCRGSWRRNCWGSHLLKGRDGLRAVRLFSFFSFARAKNGTASVPPIREPIQIAFFACPPVAHTARHRGSVLAPSSNEVQKRNRCKQNFAFTHKMWRYFSRPLTICSIGFSRFATGVTERITLKAPKKNRFTEGRKGHKGIFSSGRKCGVRVELSKTRCGSFLSVPWRIFARGLFGNGG
jgi:hypothetical protein